MSFSRSEHATEERGRFCSRKAADGIQAPSSYLQNGDVFRVLGLPDNFIVGLDAMAMTTNRSLPGFRDIPPGPHLLWVQQPDGVSRCGYWFVTEAQGLARIKEWSRYDEVLGEPVSQFEAAGREDDMASTYPTLQPYTLHDRREGNSIATGGTLPSWAQSPAHLWKTLTSAISPEALARITGKQGVTEYLVDSIDCARDTRRGENSSGVAGASNQLNFLFTQDFRDLQVLDLSSMKARVADTSARVQALLLTGTTNNNPPTERDILAELQFTFLTGTHLSNAACLEQWWNLVLKVVLRAYSLAVTRPRLASDLLQTLHAQLLYTEHYLGSASATQPNHGDGDGDGNGGRGSKDGPSGDRPIFQYKPQCKAKLHQMLAEYKWQLNKLLRGLDGHQVAPEQEAVSRAFGELEAWLWRFGWDLRGASGSERVEADMLPLGSDDEEDEQPVVVELDDEGREVGLVSFRD